MKIKIITIAKTKSDYLEAEQEFLKRLQKYAQIETLSLKEEAITRIVQLMKLLKLRGKGF